MKYLLTVEYDAVSTSEEKVESGFAKTDLKVFSTNSEYSSS